MTNKTYQEKHKSFEIFLKKKQYKQAYDCLEELLSEFPDDEHLYNSIIRLTYFNMKSYDVARKWLQKSMSVRQIWLHCVMLSEIELTDGRIDKAKELYWTALDLSKKQKDIYYEEFDSKKVLSTLLKQIRTRERNKKIIVKAKPEVGVLNKKPVQPHIPAQSQTSVKANYSISIDIPTFTEAMERGFHELNPAEIDETLLWIDYNYLSIQRSYDELLCLNTVKGIERFWYQTETVVKVLKQFKGRVLLADEVGMGKTIETGLLIKEYLLRGMVKTILILTPAALVSQWKEEMSTKFDIDFITTDELATLDEPDNFWGNKLIIASINTAKSVRHFETVTGKYFDLVVVDEAHHLKSRNTLSWKLVNQLKKKFIFLLTATPVQNNLIELFNLITLLKPGQFKTEKMFKQEYVKKGNQRMPINKEKLQELLRDVMIRNTRSLVDAKLPMRFASTIIVDPSDLEKEIYDGISTLLRKWFTSDKLNRMVLNTLIMQAGSSPFALRNTLANMKNTENADEIDCLMASIENLPYLSKGKALIEIMQNNPAEKKVVFTQYLKTMDYITGLLEGHQMTVVTFSGKMSNRQKDEAINRFKNEVKVLVCTEVGGEGRNMQFCNTLINYDLPWNPMRIEQRIGRLHRIGQERDVFIFNLAVRDSIESYILDILDSKINMFELVVGEIEPIMGHYADDKDFEDIVMDLWIKSSTKEELKKGFDVIGDDLLRAKEAYINTKALGTEIFAEDFEL
ncbi:SNF2-related protein [Candidatus Magnetominusculus xianensis]|uniref:Helicase SNF2 n=1 Tax=Candidatus Magnetominusculus xianensis TaxID=1748249 RepID=A0ABR5SAS5_9BACT|nr:SNF2-related protein [Candidatus Magnetominusculus xianensis]KWT74915.1 helicase SNF2 [Candidatus Magnetominusculus xianensis]MBF0405535.1 DEAD/DEAH box helicase family protein [Nitrospirota bacterium]